MGEQPRLRTYARTPLVFCLAMPNGRVISFLDRRTGHVAILRLCGGHLFHGLYETLGSQICPMLVYILEAGRTAVRFMNDRPAIRDCNEARPKRMLSLVIDENVVDAVFILKWIGHRAPSCDFRADPPLLS